jgi:alpha-L-fucosidase
MKRLTLIVLALAGLAVSAQGAEKWNMFERRLGMFIHWGIYSVGEWHCQQHWRKRMSRAEYEKFVSQFAAEKFSADAFVDVAESAGAEYIVFTSKHHDGFCMWDTATTDYKVTNTPAKRDIIGELAAACHRRGMKLGFYYSNPDWHHPNSHNEKSSHQLPMEPGDSPDMEKYIAYVKAQVTELLTKYGEIVCFFWDIPTKIDRPEMDELVRRLQPGIMVNDRGWGNKATCDYSTPERDYKWDVSCGRHIEACDSVGVQSWGYRKDEDYHTHGYLTRKIDSFLATGANFLLNVGPKADGTIPDESRAIMADVGKWYCRVRDSYRNVETVSGVVTKGQAVVTRRGDTLFVHFPKGLDASGLDLAPLAVLPKKATLMNTGAPLKARVELMPWSALKGKETLHVWGIPADNLANECIVLQLDFEPGALK